MPNAEFPLRDCIKLIDGNKPYIHPPHAIQWFKAEHPDGRIVTQLLSTEPIIFRAEVWIGEALVASAHASPENKTNTFRKVETAAIRRALAVAGYDAVGAAMKLGIADAQNEILGSTPTSATVMQVEVRKGKTDGAHSYLVLSCATNNRSYTVTERSRRKFIAAGWITEDDWKTVGFTDKPNPPIPVTISKNGEYYNLVTVEKKPTNGNGQHEDGPPDNLQPQQSAFKLTAPAKRRLPVDQE